MSCINLLSVQISHGDSGTKRVTLGGDPVVLVGGFVGYCVGEHHLSHPEGHGQA